MSSTIWWLILGMLLGWLIEWAIDWIYWRRRQEAIRVQVRQEFHGQVQRARTEEERLLGFYAALGVPMPAAPAGPAPDVA